jgi:hypothetical protein
MSPIGFSGSVSGDKIKGFPKRRPVIEGVLRSLRRVYGGVAKWHVRRTSGAPKA